MNVLVCFDDLQASQQLMPVFDPGEAISEPYRNALASDGLFSTFKNETMHIDCLLTGANVYDTQFRITQLLLTKKYHLVLQAGYCIGIDPMLSVGTVVNVINDKPFYFEWGAEQVKTGYETGWFNALYPPHQRGGFINMTNAYFNVMVDIEKVVATTAFIGEYPIDPAMKQFMNKAGAQVRTLNGLGLAYPCLALKQPFYQIRAVRLNEHTGEENADIATANLKSALDFILDKIK